MNRREAIQKTTLLSLASAIPVAFANARVAHVLSAPIPNEFCPDEDGGASPLAPPAHGSIRVAFVLSKGAVIIDFCGPWEVFERVNVPGRMDDAFRLYTVAKTADAIEAGGGMKIVPNYTFDNAPAPKIIVIPAQDGSSPAMLDWIRKATKTTDLTMSVCTGAFVLASTGLLSGKSATTHHAAYKTFALEFPDIRLKRGARFTEDGNPCNRGRPLLRHRLGPTSGPALLRIPGGRRHCIHVGIPGTGLVERQLERNVCQGTHLHRRTSLVSRL